MKKVLWAVMLLAPAGLAQEEDAPGKGVARLSLIAGDVSVKRGDTNEWVAAAVNGPVLAGDAVLSGTGSRAEVQFDWANLVRLSTETELRMGELDNNRYQIQLARGTIMFAIVRDSDADVDIATPSVSVRPFKKGMYRVTVRDDADGLVTEISVRSGEAEIYSPQGSQRLKAGRTMQVRGATSDPEFRSVSDIPDDEWDQWNDRRNKELLRSTSYNYVDRNVYGAEALDGHGQWVNVAPYGMVWSPTVAVGWAPYRYGRWTWANYYGWTWLSYDPWGWAPYHYGRWFWASNRWCWWPGGGGVRPYWRPALVAWVGWGAGGWGVGGLTGGVGIGRGGYGWGHVGWVPLAPHEPFYPWYGRRGGTRIVNNTTIVNNINVTNIYRNARINNGITVVERERFGRGSVHNVGVTPDRLNQAQVARGMLPVVPDRDATRWSDRNISQDSIRSQPANQQFYSRHRGAPAQQVSFADQRRNVEQVARNAFGSPPNGGSGTDARQAGAPSEGRRVGQGGEGWRRVGDNQPSLGAGGGSSYQSSGPRQPAAASSPDGQTMRGRSGNGWQRFGEPRQSDNGQTAPQRSASEGWRRVGGSTAAPGASGESFAPARSRDSGGSGATYGRESRGWERFGAVPDAGSARSNRGVDGDSGSSLNVNPPMVRDRSGSFGGAYGRSQSIPRTESPRSGGSRMESPGMSAPARGSMGGFGVGGGSRGPSSGGPSMSGPRMQSAPSAGGGAPSRGGGGGGGSVSRGSAGRGGGRGR